MSQKKKTEWFNWPDALLVVIITLDLIIHVWNIFSR